MAGALALAGALAWVGAGVGAELAWDHMAGDHMAPCFLVGIFLGLLLAFVNTLFFGLFGILLVPMVPSPVVQGTKGASPVVHHLVACLWWWLFLPTRLE